MRRLFFQSFLCACLLFCGLPACSVSSEGANTSRKDGVVEISPAFAITGALRSRLKQRLRRVLYYVKDKTSGADRNAWITNRIGIRRHLNQRDESYTAPHFAARRNQTLLGDLHSFVNKALTFTREELEAQGLKYTYPKYFLYPDLRSAQHDAYRYNFQATADFQGATVPTFQAHIHLLEPELQGATDPFRGLARFIVYPDPVRDPMIMGDEGESGVRFDCVFQDPEDPEGGLNCYGARPYRYGSDAASNCSLADHSNDLLTKP